MNRSDDGRPMKMLTIIDEYTRECLDIVVERRLNSEDVLGTTLYELFIERGVPEYIRSDNGSEFTAKAVRNGCQYYCCITVIHDSNNLLYYKSCTSFCLDNIFM